MAYFVDVNMSLHLDMSKYDFEVSKFIESGVLWNVPQLEEDIKKQYPTVTEIELTTSFCNESPLLDFNLWFCADNVSCEAVLDKLTVDEWNHIYPQVVEKVPQVSWVEMDEHRLITLKNFINDTEDFRGFDDDIRVSIIDFIIHSDLFEDYAINIDYRDLKRYINEIIRRMIRRQL